MDPTVLQWSMNHSLEQTITSFFSHLPDIAAVYLFGSQIQPEKVNRFSDVDVAVLFDFNCAPNFINLTGMRESLSESLERDVDLICLNDSGPVIGMQVLHGGKLISLKNQRINNNYFIHLLTDYADLKRVTAPHEDAIVRGGFYA
jgi:predicted nucleotidyltransferase